VKNTDQKVRLDEDQQNDLKEAINIAARHYAHLAKEAHVLGEPYYAEFLEGKARHFLMLASQAQDVTRVTVRLRADLPF
jgi:hypothetical protein